MTILTDAGSLSACGEAVGVEVMVDIENEIGSDMTWNLNLDLRLNVQNETD